MLEINSLIIKDLLKLIVPCIFLMILVLFLSFRTLEGVIIPLLNVFVSVVWTAGIMALLHVDVTIISNIIPVVLLAVGSAYSIHMISKFYEEEKIQSDNKKANEVAGIRDERRHGSGSCCRIAPPHHEKRESRRAVVR